MAAPLYSWEGHELNWEPRIFKFLKRLADELYGGNMSKAANSIVLFSWIHFVNEKAAGRTPTHWLTKPAVQEPNQLEDLLPMIERIEATGNPEDIGTWWRHELEELQKRNDRTP